VAAERAGSRAGREPLRSDRARSDGVVLARELVDHLLEAGAIPAGAPAGHGVRALDRAAAPSGGYLAVGVAAAGLPVYARVPERDHVLRRAAAGGVPGGCGRGAGPVGGPAPRIAAGAGEGAGGGTRPARGGARVVGDHRG